MTAEQRLLNLRTKLADAMKRRDYIKASKLQSEISVLLKQTEGCTLDSINKDLSVQEQNESIILMNKVMIMADLLQGYARDFFAFVKKRDSSIQSIDICRKANEAANLCLSITKNISATFDEDYVNNFQSICDETDVLICKVLKKNLQKNKKIKKDEEKDKTVSRKAKTKSSSKDSKKVSSKSKKVAA